MSASELKLALHQIIDQVKDNRILQAVHTILSSQVSIFAHTTDGKPVTKEELDMMLESSEEDIKAGRLFNQKDVKEEIKTWRKEGKKILVNKVFDARQNPAKLEL